MVSGLFSASKMFWPPEVVATLPWRDVVWAHAHQRVLVFNDADEIIGHVGVFSRDATWDGRAVKVGGIGGVATREDSRQRGVSEASNAKGFTGTARHIQG